MSRQWMTTGALFVAVLLCAAALGDETAVAETGNATTAKTTTTEVAKEIKSVGNSTAASDSPTTLPVAAKTGADTLPKTTAPRPQLKLVLFSDAIAPVSDDNLDVEAVSAVIAAAQNSSADVLVNLGDLAQSLDRLSKLSEMLLGSGVANVVNVVGNRDLALLSDANKTQVPKVLNISTGDAAASGTNATSSVNASEASAGAQRRYFSRDVAGGAFRIIVLDGLDVSFIVNNNTTTHESFVGYLAKVPKADVMDTPQMKQSGAVSERQLQWLEDQLSDSRARGQRAIVLIHFPTYPKIPFNDTLPHNLWNDYAVNSVLSSFNDTVAVVFSAHSDFPLSFRTELRACTHFIALCGAHEKRGVISYAVVTIDSDFVSVEKRGCQKGGKLSNGCAAERQMKLKQQQAQKAAAAAAVPTTALKPKAPVVAVETNATAPPKSDSDMASSSSTKRRTAETSEVLTTEAASAEKKDDVQPPVTRAPETTPAPETPAPATPTPETPAPVQPTPQPETPRPVTAVDPTPAPEQPAKRPSAGSDESAAPAVEDKNQGAVPTQPPAEAPPKDQKEATPKPPAGPSAEDGDTPTKAGAPDGEKSKDTSSASPDPPTEDPLAAHRTTGESDSLSFAEQMNPVLFYFQIMVGAAFLVVIAVLLVKAADAVGITRSSLTSRCENSAGAAPRCWVLTVHITATMFAVLSWVGLAVWGLRRFCQKKPPGPASEATQTSPVFVATGGATGARSGGAMSLGGAKGTAALNHGATVAVAAAGPSGDANAGWDTNWSDEEGGTEMSELQPMNAAPMPTTVPVAKPSGAAVKGFGAAATAATGSSGGVTAVGAPSKLKKKLKE